MPTDTKLKPMPAGKKAEPDDGLTQSERFMQAARQLECDDDPERFVAQVRKIAKVSPMSQIKNPKPASTIKPKA